MTASPKAIIQPANPPAAPEANEAHRILVVEDDVITRTALVRTLERAGFAVTAVDSAEGAFAAAQGSRFELAVCDIGLPGMSGIELAGALAAPFGIPALMLSSQQTDDVVKGAIEAGALGYLVKPLDPRAVVPAILTALRRAAEMNLLRASGARLGAAASDNREMNTALGILMERHGLARAAAFERLRTVARRERRKMSDVARAFLAGQTKL